MKKHRPCRKRRKQRPRPSAGQFLTSVDRQPAEVLAAMKAKPCLLCCGSAAVAGFLCPKDQGRFNAPPGKVRLIAYTLCAECFNRPNVTQAVEKVVFAQAGDPSRN